MDLKTKRRIRILTLLLIVSIVLVIAFSGTASAAWWNPISWIVGSIELIAGIVKAVLNLVRMIVKLSGEGVIGFIAGIVKTAMEKFFDLMKYLLTRNPTVYCSPTATDCSENTIVAAIVPTIMLVIQPLYVMMTIFTGMYYIFAAIDPKRRSNAKNMMMKLLVGMVICGLAMPLYQFTMNLSSSITKTVFEQGYASFAGENNTSIAVFAVIMVVAIVVFPNLLLIAIFVVLYILIAVLLVMAVRYVAVVLFAILFPVALFLYFFDSTKSMGASILYQAISWIFIPTVQAMMIVITFFALEGMITGGSDVTDPASMESMFQGNFSIINAGLMFFMVLGGLLGIIISPLVMMQLMRWVGGALAGYGMLKIPQAETKEEFWKAAGMTALGGTMMGGVSRALPFVATEAAYMSSFSPTFADAATWSDVLPDSWFGSRSRYASPGYGGSSGGAGGGSGGGGGIGAPAWSGAAARAREARMARGERRPGGVKESKGLVRDFFQTYADALTYDKRHVADMMAKYGPGGSEAGGGGGGAGGGGRGAGGGRVMPISTGPTLAAQGRDRIGQETTISPDSSGARSVYMPKVEGPPFLSIPLYYFGGLWGKSLSRASEAFKQGKIAKGVGISLFETFKMFSPFRPIRHLGRIIYTAIPEFVPPIPFPVPFIGWNLRDVAWWGSRKMAGIGFGQMASRTGWAVRLASAEGEFNTARKKMEKAQGNKTNEKPARTAMDEAAKKYALALETVRDGGGIRGMKDPEYFNKKLRQLYDYNKDLHFGVMKHLRSKGVVSKDDILDGVERIKNLKGDRKKLNDYWEKRIKDGKDDEKIKFQAQKDRELLLLDFVNHKYKNLQSVKADPVEKMAEETSKRLDEFEGRNALPAEQEKQRQENMLDFMKHNAAMQFGVGVQWSVDDKGKWSPEGFDWDGMQQFIEKHDRATSRWEKDDKGNLVQKGGLVAEDDGKFKMSAYRVLDGAAYGCATQNEMLTLPNGRKVTNIHIIDGQKDWQLEVAELKGEKEKLKEEKEKLEAQSRTPAIQAEIQELEGRINALNNKAEALRKSERSSVYSFVDTDGSNYTERMRNHYETGGGTQAMWGEKDERSQQALDAGWHIDAKRRLVVGDTGAGFIDHFSYRQVGQGDYVVHYKGVPVVDLQGEGAAEAERILKGMGKRVRASDITRDNVLAISEKDAEYIVKTALQKAGKSAADVDAEISSLKKEEKLQSRALQQKRADVLAGIVRDTETHATSLGYASLADYRQHVEAANRAIYWSGAMVDSLRRSGYSERDIDDIKLTVFHNERYQTLVNRGENVDMRVVSNVNNHESAWVNTDKAGRRTLTINVASEPKDQLMENLQKGDLLGHETTHDWIREHYGDASYTDIWRDFTKSGASRMEKIFDQASLDQVRNEIQAELHVSDLSNTAEVRAALRQRNLSEDDIGRMLCEGLSDVGGTNRAGAEHAPGGAYDTSVSRFVEGDSTRLAKTAEQENHAKIKIGGFESNITDDDLSTLARMESLSTQLSGYVADQATRQSMENSVNDAKTKLGAAAQTDRYTTTLSIYQIIHGHAVILPTPGSTGTGPTPTGAPTGPTPSAGSAPATAEASPGPAPATGAEPTRPSPTPAAPPEAGGKIQSFDEFGLEEGDRITSKSGTVREVTRVIHDEKEPGGGYVEVKEIGGNGGSGRIDFQTMVDKQDVIANVDKPKLGEGVDLDKAPARLRNALKQAERGIADKSTPEENKSHFRYQRAKIIREINEAMAPKPTGPTTPPIPTPATPSAGPTTTRPAPEQPSTGTAGRPQMDELFNNFDDIWGYIYDKSVKRGGFDIPKEEHDAALMFTTLKKVYGSDRAVLAQETDGIRNRFQKEVDRIKREDPRVSDDTARTRAINTGFDRILGERSAEIKAAMGVADKEDAQKQSKMNQELSGSPLSMTTGQKPMLTEFIDFITGKRSWTK